VTLATNGTAADASIVNATALDLAASAVGGNLIATATTGNVTDSGAVTVGGTSTLTTSNADDDIDLGTLASTGSVALTTTGTTGNASIVNATALDLAASTVNGNLIATATTGNLTDSGTVAVTGTTSLTTSAADATIDLGTLASTGAVTLGTNGAAGNASIVNASALDLAASAVGGNLIATATTGSLTDSAATTVGGNASYTTTDSAGNIDLGTQTVVGTTSLNTLGNATYVTTGDVSLAGSNVGSALTLTTTGDITDASGTALTVVGLATLNAGTSDITLGDNVADVTNFGSVNLNGTTLVVSEDSDTVLAGATATTFTLTSAGGVTDTAPIIVETLNLVAAGPVVLDQAANDFGTNTVNFQVTNGGLELVDVNDLSIRGSATGDVTVTANDGAGTINVVSPEEGSGLLAAQNGLSTLDQSAAITLNGETSLTGDLRTNAGDITVVGSLTLDETTTINSAGTTGTSNSTITLNSINSPTSALLAIGGRVVLNSPINLRSLIIRSAADYLGNVLVNAETIEISATNIRLAANHTASNSLALFASGNISSTDASIVFEGTQSLVMIAGNEIGRDPETQSTGEITLRSGADKVILAFSADVVGQPQISSNSNINPEFARLTAADSDLLPAPNASGVVIVGTGTSNVFFPDNTISNFVGVAAAVAASLEERGTVPNVLASALFETESEADSDVNAIALTQDQSLVPTVGAGLRLPEGQLLEDDLDEDGRASILKVVPGQASTTPKPEEQAGKRLTFVFPNIQTVNLPGKLSVFDAEFSLEQVLGINAQASLGLELTLISGE
jgi:hypothetical protein